MEIPLKKADRIEVIDVLRGFTLLGIILVHFTEQYYAGQPPEKAGTFGNNNLADNILSAIIGTFISGKFYMIFSFMFGMSFFIQLDRSNGQPAFLGRFFWRLIMLFVIGFVHSLHYRGDILTIYAVLGVVLLLCYRLPDKVLLIIALLFTFDIPSVMTRTFGILFPSDITEPISQNQAILELYWNTLKTGSYIDILKANVHEIIPKFEFQVTFGRLYITIGLFLLGLYAGRKNVFQDMALFRRLIKYSLYIIAGCILVALAVFLGMNQTGRVLSQQTGFLIGGGLMDIFNAALATIYVGIIVRLFQKEKWRNRLMVFYSVGRMGLTTYLMQTLVGIFIFFSFGLDQLGEISVTICAMIAIGVFIIQIIFSNYWMKNFQYGPVEWLWRSLTFLNVQPLKK